MSLKESVSEVFTLHLKKEGFFTGFIIAICLCMMFMMYSIVYKPELFEKFANTEVKEKLVEQSFTVFSLTQENENLRKTNEELVKANERLWARLKGEQETPPQENP